MNFDHTETNRHGQFVLHCIPLFTECTFLFNECILAGGWIIWLCINYSLLYVQWYSFNQHGLYLKIQRKQVKSTVSLLRRLIKGVRTNTAQFGERYYLLFGGTLWFLKSNTVLHRTDPGETFNFQMQWLINTRESMALELSNFSPACLTWSPEAGLIKCLVYTRLRTENIIHHAWYKTRLIAHRFWALLQNYLGKL